MINHEINEKINKSLSSIKISKPLKCGVISKVVGLTLEAVGIKAPIGAYCEIECLNKQLIDAEVVGFHDEKLFLMPFSEPTGISPGSIVRLISDTSSIFVGNDMLGRVLDGKCNPIDGKAVPFCESEISIDGNRINPMDRGIINKVLDVGVKAINGILTMGMGQRMGLIAGSGVGKSVLLGMLTKYTEADVVVIGLIGERGREVREFIADSLGEEGLKKSVVIASPANESPIMRLKATSVSHAIAEYFRDQGKNVLLLLDSITRVAHAQREIGLAIGEPPTSRGFPPSVFALLPKLIERAGVGKKGFGSITAIYTVLAESDDINDPIVDIARASLDGQVILSRSLSDASHYPAIDLKGSISRVMQSIVDPSVQKLANKARRMWTLYQENEDLIKVGAYEIGSNSEIDEAIKLRPQLQQFLLQNMSLGVDHKTTLLNLQSIFPNKINE